MLTFICLFVFYLFPLFSFAASKTVLNSMLKEPSLIQDPVLAKNIFQVSALNFKYTQKCKKKNYINNNLFSLNLFFIFYLLFTACTVNF